MSCGNSANLRLHAATGQSRAQAENALKGNHYCRLEPREQSKQSYVRCGVKGYELGESWVVVDYDELGSVTRVTRMEHFEDGDKATERWNALAQERGQSLGAESAQARSRLAALGEAPEGAVLWKAWQGTGLDELVGLYLVRPSDPKDPQVVEVLRLDRKNN